MKIYAMGPVLALALVLGFIAPAPAFAAGGVLINEFVSNPGSGGSEWVELYNPSASPVDVNNWSIQDLTFSGGGGKVSSGTATTTITTAKAYAVVTDLGTGATSTQATTTIPANGFLVVDMSGLNNGGDKISLFDDMGTQVDSVAYGNQNEGGVPAPGGGLSAYRLEDGGSQWAVTDMPTPGETNATAIPSVATEAQVSDVYISPLGHNGQGDGTIDHPYKTYDRAVGTLLDGGTLHLLPGVYDEGFTVSRPIKVEGVATTTGVAEVDAQITITASGTAATTTTVSNLTISNPAGTTGVLVDGGSHVAITGNTIKNIGTTLASGSAQAVAIVGSADMNDVLVSGNTMENIGNLTLLHAGTAGSSAKGVYVGNSNGAYTLSGISITGNTMHDIYASTADWMTGGTGGGAGAYGVLVNYGASGTGSVPGVTITGNTITTLEALWAHGIGLEGNTPNAVVTGNTISGLVDHKSPSDAVGVNIEDNAGSGTFDIVGLSSVNTIDTATVTWPVVDKTQTSRIYVNSAWAANAAGDLVDIGGGVAHVIGTNAAGTLSGGLSIAPADGTVAVMASTSPYMGDVSISTPLTLTSADPSNMAHIEGAIMVTTGSTTVSYLEVTNPTGVVGISVPHADGVTISHNTLHSIGSSSVTGAVQAINVHEGSSNVTIDHNTIYDVTSAGYVGSSAKYSAKGIYLGDFAGTNPIANVSIADNTIYSVKSASTTPEGMWGAYGVLVNRETTGLSITGNTVHDLEGLWAHAIGLEGNTPSAVVSGNTVTNLVDHKSPSDAAALYFEDNASAGTVTGTGNAYGGLPLILATDAMVADASLATLSPGAHTYPEVRTDGGYAYYGLNIFPTIQQAVDAAASGSTVKVMAGDYSETVTLNHAVSLLGPNSDINPNGATARASEATLTGTISVYAGDTSVKGFTITDPAYGGATIKGVHIYHSGSTISNITVANNIFTNIANSEAHGAYGAMVQGDVNNVQVVDNKFDGISSAGWAHALEVTPTCNSLPVPQNVTVTGNVIRNVTSTQATPDALGLSVDWCDSPANYADASAVGFHKNNLSGVLVQNLDTGHVLDASRNYWGTTNATAIDAQVLGGVTYAPWYTDVGMTTLMWPTTTLGDESTTTIENDTTLTGTSTAPSSVPVTITIPAGTVVTGSSAWDGTIGAPSPATPTLTLPGYTVTVTSGVTVGSPTSDLLFSQPVKLVFGGRAGERAGFFNHAGTFGEITDTCDGVDTPTVSAAPLSTTTPGQACKHDDGSDLVVWTTHLSTYVTYTATVNAPVITPNGGDFTNSVAVTVDDSAAGAGIRYTLDGTDPACGANLGYTNGQTLTFTTTTTLKAIRCDAGGATTASPIASATFTKVASASSGGGGGGGAISPVTTQTQTQTQATTTTQTQNQGGEVLGAATYRFTRNLMLGSTGDDVTALQKLMLSLGFPIPLLSSGKASYGYYGSETRAAVIAYQKAHNITPAVGYFGPLTRAEVNKGQVSTTPEFHSNLTTEQAQAILGLITSFGADPSVVANVKASLGL